MKEGIYKRDYSVKKKTQIVQEESQAEAEFIKAYSEFMQILPKRVSAEKKAEYDRILKECDRLASNEGGKIQAFIDSKRCEAWIEITLPFLEFTSKEEFRLLADISNAAEYANIHSSEDRKISFRIRLPYFEEYIGGENLDKLFNNLENNR